MQTPPENGYLDEKGSIIRNYSRFHVYINSFPTENAKSKVVLELKIICIPKRYPNCGRETKDRYVRYFC